MAKRSKPLIQNPYRASQVLDYAGMLEAPLSPTDIDGLIEWHNRAYIIIEVKHGHAQMRKGQRLALERMVKDFNKAGKSAVAIVVEHYVDDTQKSVFVASKIVREVYFDVERQWRSPHGKVTARDFVQGYIEWLNSNKVSQNETSESPIVDKSKNKE